MTTQMSVSYWCQRLPRSFHLAYVLVMIRALRLLRMCQGAYGRVLHFGWRLFQSPASKDVPAFPVSGQEKKVDSVDIDIAAEANMAVMAMDNERVGYPTDWTKRRPSHIASHSKRCKAIESADILKRIVDLDKHRFEQIHNYVEQLRDDSFGYTKTLAQQWLHLRETETRQKEERKASVDSDGRGIDGKCLPKAFRHYF